MSRLTLFVALLFGGARAAAADDLRALVGRLGDPSYPVRAAAAQELRRLGRDAEPALRAGLVDADPEVRRACAALLPFAGRSPLDVRLDDFLLSRDDKSDSGLVGWPAFRRLAGDDLSARHLFVELVRHDRPILEALEKDPKKVAAQVADRQKGILSRSAAPNADGAPRPAEVYGFLLAARCAGPEAWDGRNFSLLSSLSYRAPMRSAVAASAAAQRLLEPILVPRIDDADVASVAFTIALNLDMTDFMEQRLRPTLRRQIAAARSAPHDLHQMYLLCQLACQFRMTDEAARVLRPTIRQLAESVGDLPNDTSRFHNVFAMTTLLGLKDVTEEALKPAVRRVLAAAADDRVAGTARLLQAHSYATQLGMTDDIEAYLKPAVLRRAVAAARGPYDASAFYQATTLARQLKRDEILDALLKPAARRQIAILLKESDDPTRFSQAVSLAQNVGLNDTLEDTLRPAARALTARALAKSADLPTLTRYHQLLQSVGDRAGIDTLIKPALKKALFAAADDAPSAATTYQAFQLVQTLRLKEGLPLALKVGQARELNSHTRAQALLFVAGLGGKEEIASLEGLFADPTAVGSMGFNQTTVHATLGDVALGAAVALSGQKLKDFGFPWFETFAGGPVETTPPQCLGFADDAGRRAAVKKWRDGRGRSPH